MRLCLLLLTCVSLSAQSVEKSVISAIGNSYSGQNFSVSYNTGELVIGSQSSRMVLYNLEVGITLHLI